VDRDELLASVDLEALLDSLTGGSRGRRWHCPDRDHPDEHPSVSVRVGDDGVQRWHCWSGGHGGTAIDAVAAAHGVSVGEAIRWIAAHHTHLPAPTPQPLRRIAPIGGPDPALAVYVERAARLLWTPAGESQRAWLAARGLRPEVLRANQVGADPGRRYLPRPQGMPAGWPAVVYPAHSPDGRVLYAQARILDPHPERSKYDNPSAELAANPQLAWTKPIGPTRDDLLLLCEGTADALVAAQAGIRSVGVFSAYPHPGLAGDLAIALHGHPHLWGRRLVVCFDADTAGRGGAERLAELLDERGVPVETFSPPDGLDLTVWAAADPDWHRTLPARNPTPAIARPEPGAESPTVRVEGRGLSIGGIR
jgi:hypothetical protein